jgi:3-dehydroquinate synthase
MTTIRYHQTPVYVGASWDILPELVDFNIYSKVILLVDENVYRWWKERFVNYLYIVIPSGEEQKSLLVVENLVQDLIAMDADRNTLLIGVGGGVVCDITGFVGAVFMRGIDVGFVPTTLLAQVDASVGGKNGVNTGKYKNMIGTITQPVFILSDSSFLATLPEEEFANGMAEVIKHGCILDENYYSFIEENRNKIRSRDSDTMDYVVQKSVELKSSVVAKDEREIGQRKLLNYGHTFGHAIEKKYNIPHGQAVSLGIIMVNEFSVKKGVLSVLETNRIKDLLAFFGLPVAIENYAVQELLPLVLHDKKRISDALQLITLKRIGEGEITPVRIDEFM